MFPKVKRGYPVDTSIPMVEIRMPPVIDMSPLTLDPLVMTALMESPRTPSQKYSKWVNLRANRARVGDIVMSRRTPMSPPRVEQKRSSMMAREPLPCLLIS